jgi:hypothetical protein
VIDDHGPPGFIDAPFDNAEDDGGCAFFDRQIAGDDATQMQGIVRAYGRVSHDGAVNVEIARNHQRTFDLSLHGLHEEQLYVANVPRASAMDQKPRFQSFYRPSIAIAYLIGLGLVIAWSRATARLSIGHASRGVRPG